MGIFDALFKQKEQEKYLVLNDGLKLDEIGIDIMFIVKNNQVIYVNDDTNHLFILDKSNDKKLDGRIVKITYASSQNTIEIFVAFDESESYMLFTLQQGIDERLNQIASYIWEYFYKKNISNVFVYTENVKTEFERTFKLYKKEEQYFMVNNGQTQVYIVDKNNIQRSNYNATKADKLKMLFWSRG
jgi:hypothetical protein